MIDDLGFMIDDYSPLTSGLVDDCRFVFFNSQSSFIIHK
jgi:hypothetical protein